MTIHFTNIRSKKSTTIALHSSASNGSQWNYLSREMEDKFEVVTPNLPGYGRNAVIPSRLHNGMDAIAAPLIDQMKKSDNGVHLIGHSFGAGVAINIAINRPDLIKSLTLYEPASFHFLEHGTADHKKRFAEIKLISAVLTASALSERADLGMMRFINFWNGDQAWNNLSATTKEKFANQLPTVMSNFANGFAETWSPADLAQIEIPTLMMKGTQSPKVAQAVSVAIAEAIPTAKLATFSELGHMAPVFQPEIITPLIREHISSTENPTSPFGGPINLASSDHIQPTLQRN